MGASRVTKTLTAVAAVAFIGWAAPDMARATQSSSMTVVETAQSTDDFTTLVAAVQAAGLVETLQGDGPYTVFAPTNEAFAQLPAGTVESLLKPENKDKLTEILTYHVVSGKVMSGDLAGQETEAKTVQGSTVDIDATGDGVTVNDAQVKTADIVASNGVIHVIDKVLMPN